MTGTPPIQLLAPEYATPDNPGWHKLRRGGVTASEIAVILGLSTWDSPWALWHRKIGLIGDAEAGESADWGRRLESAIAEAAADRLDPHENLVIEEAGLYAHAERPWQMATPDRLVLTDRCVCGAVDELDVCTCMPHEAQPVALLEIKHPYSWDGWGDEGTDDVPAAYLAQCLWQLDVMDLDQCWLAAYARHEMRIYTIRRDESTEADLEMMREAAHAFLSSSEPPPLDGHPATLAAVRQLHPDIEDRDQEISADIAGEYAAAREAATAAEARKRAAEAALREAMGAARRGVVLTDDGPTPVATRSIHERRSIDTKRLRADHPDIADAYTSTSTVDRLLPARTRKDTQ